MGRIPPWSDLPQELLSTIAYFLLPDPIDILSFRTVCKSWCSSSLSLSSPLSTLSPHFPLTTPPPPYTLLHRYSSLSSEPPVLSVTVIYALRSSSEQHDGSHSSIPRAWVLFLDKFTSGKVSIRKPFSKNSYSLPLNFPRTLNLLDLHASELGRFYNLSFSPNRYGNVSKPRIWCGLVLKVVLFKNDDGFVVVVALSDEGKLGLLRLGLGNDFDSLGIQSHWEVIHDGKGFRFDDIVDFKGRVLGIDRRGRVYEIKTGCSSSMVMRVGVPPIVGGGGRRKRLVESLGRLYLAVRCNVRGENDAVFKVYELNVHTKKWLKVNCLGDRTFFLGPEFSFSASAVKLHGSCGKNCILFEKQSFGHYDGGDDDSAMFSKLERRDLHIGAWSLEDAAHVSVIKSYPNYSEVFWPPPTWIWPNYMCERIGSLFTVLDRLQMKIPDYDELKIKFEEFSLPKQRDALTIMKLALKIKETLHQAREVDKMLKQIEMLAVSFEQPGKSVNLRNQVGTSTHETEEKPASVNSFQILKNANKGGNGNHILLSMEMNLNMMILNLEEDTSEVEDSLNSPKMTAILSLVHGLVE